ncbi:MAG: serine/threonine-protein kinase [Acidimicrobiales bacterium]
MTTPKTIGNYVVERALGSGSFATVWLATDPLLEAPVAIKVLADNWSRQADVRRRFIDEARIMRRIDDDRVVRIHQVGELADGRAYFVMSWADKGSLEQRMADRRQSGVPFRIDEVLALSGELASCLRVIHAEGVVHRDVKPSNVLFQSGRGGERMVLADFGLAKDLVRSSGFTLAAGTPAYMAPEQSRPSAAIDNRADVYAATAIVYELLSGQPPAPVEADRLPLASLRSDLPAGLEEVLRCGLEHDVERRFATIDELAAALAEACAVIPGPSPSPRPFGDAVAALLDDIDNGVFGRLAGTEGARERLHARLAIASVAGEARELAADIAGEVTRVTGTRLRTASVDSLDPAMRDLAVADVLVLSVPPREWLGSAFAGVVPGPVVVVTATDADSSLELVTASAVAHDAVAASAALAIVEDQALRTWRSAAILRRVADIRLGHPELAELTLVRDVITGRRPIPMELVDEVVRLLLPGDARSRLGIDNQVSEEDVRLEASARARRWRLLRATGRIAAASLTVADAAGDLCGRLSLEIGAVVGAGDRGGPGSSQ